MIADTIEEMISLLEECPLDIPLQDRHENYYHIVRVVTREQFPGVPCLVMMKFGEGFGTDHNLSGTTLDLLSLLIGLSMDERFKGKKSRVYQTTDYRDKNMSNHTIGFSIAKMKDRLLIRVME